MFSLDRAWQSLRLLTRHKRFAATAMICLGVGIALNTTMYSVLDAMLNPRLDMRSPERIYRIGYYGNYKGLIPLQDQNKALLEGLTTIEGAAGVRMGGFDRIIERDSRLREARIISVTPNYFSLLGLRPSAGRLPNAADYALPTRPVVLGERMWRQLFPEKTEFEPSPVRVQGEPRIVVGILPYSADFPGQYTDVWQLESRDNLPLVTLSIVRLKESATVAQLGIELNAVDLRYKQTTNEGKTSGFRLDGAIRPPFRPYRFHWALIGAVVAVLLIACANLANLQLARGVSRTRELATRAAIGASRGDIISQLMLESAWLALGGLALGAVLTVWGIHLVDAFVPPAIADYVAYPQVSWRVAAFAVGATLFALMLVGLAPAIKLSRVDVGELMKTGAGTGATRSARKQYGALVVTEVALALALLASTGLLMKAAYTVRQFNVKYDSRGLISVGVAVSPASKADRRTRREWAEILMQRALSADSIVGAATTVGQRPPSRAIAAYDLAGQPVNKFVAFYWYSIVSPEFFRVSRIPIVAGRDFSPGEFAESQVIVDLAAARSLWQNANPIGKQIKLDSAHKRSPWLTVVGVADPAADYFMSDQDHEESMARWRRTVDPSRFSGRVWVLNAADTGRIGSIVARNFTGDFIDIKVRVRGDPRRAAMNLNAKFANSWPNVRASYPRTWDEATGVTRLRARQDFIATLFTTFSVFALALAALGVYSIIAHMVAQRTREFGVRIAVGAGEPDIRELVIREGNVLTLLGIAAGLILTYLSADWVRAFVFSDWDRYDSRVFAVAALVLFGAAWLASYVPARRAMRIDPVEALRND